MKTLSFEQMENVQGGANVNRNDSDCYMALAGFTLSCLGIIGTGGLGAVVAGGSLALSYYSMTTSC